MKLFVWHRVGDMTENWHSEAGVVVVAETLERARVLALQRSNHEKSDTEPHELLTKEPDVIRDGTDGPEACWIHKDAGCC